MALIPRLRSLCVEPKTYAHPLSLVIWGKSCFQIDVETAIMQHSAEIDTYFHSILHTHTTIAHTNSISTEKKNCTHLL